MLVRLWTWFYRRLGASYPRVYLTLELHTALIIAAATVALFSLYYDFDAQQLLEVLGVVLALTWVAVAASLLRAYRRVRPIEEWIDGARGPDETARAWAAAVGLPLELLRRDMPMPLALTVVPGCLAAVALLDLAWVAFVPLFAGALVAVGYAMILHYLAIEAGMRPVLVDISREVSPRLSQPPALSLRVRLLASLPLINIITGLVVAAFTADSGQATSLGLDVLVAVAVATVISLELTVMLSKSILRPIADLQRATNAVGRGRLDVAVPVTTGDELGDLAASFNQMVTGLRDRERIREAFGTYLDEEVAEYILSDAFTKEGMEFDVSILFCDAKGFTQFAARANASEVVARLNDLFETVVPVVARHGGHVDKFEGDGMLAVFGAPEQYPDHADRAVRAAIEIATRVNRVAPHGFRVGVGVNTGRVVAGSIGGGGRLNFSVIGDPVNIAYRTEAATRTTGDDVLITAETERRLDARFELAERGEVIMKGVDEPATLYAPRVPDTLPEPGDELSETLGAPLGRALAPNAAARLGQPTAPVYGGHSGRGSTLPGA